MGLGIEYRIRLANPASVAPCIVDAIKQAKKRRWKVRRRSKSSPFVAFSPHANCDDVVLDFSQGPACEHYVKTNFAGARVHIDVASFLDAIKPRCVSLSVDDETGYFKKRDRKALASALSGFKLAINARFGVGKRGVSKRDGDHEGAGMFQSYIIHADGRAEPTKETRETVPAESINSVTRQINRLNKQASVAKGPSKSVRAKPRRTR